MTDDSCEPWSNGHQLAADVMALVERLSDREMTLDAVRRSLLRRDEIALLLPDEERRAGEVDLLEGLETFVGRLGRSRAFGDAIRREDERAERFRARFGWETLPGSLRALCERRATTVLERALREGFVTGPEPYRITAEGRAFLARGGYPMR